jgi:type VII secretion protein EccE
MAKTQAPAAPGGTMVQPPPAPRAAVAGSAARPPSTRRRGRIGPLTIVQLVVLELAALVLLAGRQADGAVVGTWTIAAGVAAVVALGMVFLRARGGWWYQERGSRRRWQRRRSDRTPARVPGLGVLGPLAPGLTIRSVEDRGTRIGVGQDAGGWFAVLALDNRADLADEHGADLPLDRLGRVLADASSVSVVTQLTLAPSVELDARAPVVQSYQELLGQAPVAADESRWVAVRLAPPDAAAAAASRGGGLEGVDRALIALVGRVGKVLSVADVTATPLDRDGLATALATACGLTGRPGEAEEQWTTWYADGLAHSCLLLTRWPRPGPAELFRRLAGLPGTLVSVSVTLHGDGEQPRLQGVVRVAADPKTLARTVDEARTLARRHGAQLRRVDGYHGPGVYACAPTAAVLS